KVKKRAAVRKMEATEQNLTRVRDILGEIGRRLGSLERQAKKAERFKKYRTEMREIDLWTSTHRWLAESAEAKRAQRDEARLAAEESEAEAELVSQEALVERLRHE